ncbi:MAG: transposase [Psychrobacillus psychrodurans]
MDTPSKSFGTYGSPRIAQDLAGCGYVYYQKKIANMMRDLGLCALLPKSVQHNRFKSPSFYFSKFIEARISCGREK